MSLLHMETDSVQTLAQQLQQSAYQIEGDNYRLQTSLNRLDYSWSGADAEVFVADMRHLLRQIDQLVEGGARLGQRLQAEADEWITVDSQLQVAAEGGFNWLQWSSSVFGAVMNFQDVTYDSMKTIGRGINQLVGNQRGGWVGRMDDLAHSLKSPKLKAMSQNKLISDGIPLIVDMYGDYKEGDSWHKTLFTEVAEVGVKKVFYAVPVVGQAYMFYDIGLGVGHLAAGGLELAGFHEQAAWLQNTLEVVDPATYIDRGLEHLYDEYLADRAAPILDDVPGKLVDFGSGLWNDTRDVFLL